MSGSVLKKTGTGWGVRMLKQQEATLICETKSASSLSPELQRKFDNRLEQGRKPVQELFDYLRKRGYTSIAMCRKQFLREIQERGS